MSGSGVQLTLLGSYCLHASSDTSIRGCKVAAGPGVQKGDKRLRWIVSHPLLFFIVFFRPPFFSSSSIINTLFLFWVHSCTSADTCSNQHCFTSTVDSQHPGRSHATDMSALFQQVTRNYATPPCDNNLVFRTQF